MHFFSLIFGVLRPRSKNTSYIGFIVQWFEERKILSTEHMWGDYMYFAAVK